MSGFKTSTSSARHMSILVKRIFEPSFIIVQYFLDGIDSILIFITLISFKYFI